MLKNVGKLDERIITKHKRKYKNDAFAMNECNEQSGFTPARK